MKMQIIHLCLQPSPYSLLLMILCVVDVTSERVWVKKPGEKITSKVKPRQKPAGSEV